MVRGTPGFESLNRILAFSKVWQCIYILFLCTKACFCTHSSKKQQQPMDFDHAHALRKFNLQFCVTFSSDSQPTMRPVKFSESIFVPHLVWWATEPGEHANYERTSTREMLKANDLSVDGRLPRHIPRDLQIHVSLLVTSDYCDPVELPWFSAGVLEQKKTLILEYDKKRNNVRFTHARVWFDDTRVVKVEFNRELPEGTPTIWQVLHPLVHNEVRKRRREQAEEQLEELPKKRRRIDEEYAAKIAALEPEAEKLRQCIVDNS